METIGQFTDPRLVAIYETVNAYGPNTQPAFYAQLAEELGARSIIDVGCGTGLITRDLAAQGYRLTGVDPAPLMIEVARSRPFGDQVTWVVGDASALVATDADLAIMSGHVAQFFPTEESWHDTLSAIHAALRPGGHLAFESRNPAAREWERWTGASRRAVTDPTAGLIEAWAEFHEAGNGIVSYANHYRFVATGEELVSPNRLRFRSQEELARTLADAGFTVERVYGDWDRRPPGPATRELIVVAVR